MVWFLNAFIHFMGSLPFSVTRGLVITFPESLVLYMILITGAVYISVKKKVWLFISLFLMILLSGCFLWERSGKVSKSSFTVYDVKGIGLYDFISGGKSILVGGLSVMKDPFFHDMIMKSRWNTKVTGLFEFQYPLPNNCNNAFHSEGFFRKWNYIGFRGKRIVILNKSIPLQAVRKLEVDYLIVTRNPKIKMKDLLRNFKPGLVILDASVPLWKVKEWMKEAHWLGIRCYSISISGAFTVAF
jgi:competence protein ComEC